MTVQTRAPTQTDLDRLARIAEQGTASTPQPGVETVVRSCLHVIAKLRRAGRTWPEIARLLADQGLLGEEEPLEPQNPSAADGPIRLALVMGPDDITDQQRFRPLRATTLRAAAWRVNRADGAGYDLRR